MPCEHPYIAIQPDLLEDGKGSRPIALCLNPECALHAMALRIVDREFLDEVKRVAAREWDAYKESKHDVAGPETTL